MFKKIQISHIVFALLLFCGVFSLQTKLADAAPATFNVTNTNDSGAGSLRQAIIDANSNANPLEQDRITFSITGTGVHTIMPTVYYNITEPVEIDGYSQSGSTANTQSWPNPFNGTLTIEINGVNNTSGLGTFLINSNNIVFKGLIANGTPSTEFQFSAEFDDIKLYGNYIGTNTTGLIKANSQHGLSGASGTGLVVGGALPGQRNLFATEYAALTADGDGPVIKGNYFGVGSDGVTALPSSPTMNTYLVDITGNNAQIGGNLTGEGNSFENSNNHPVLNLTASTNSAVLGNRFAGNYSAIHISGVSDGTVIGDGSVGGRNIISGNDIISAFDGVNRGDAINMYNAGKVSIKGNYIGVADDGTTALGNGKNGIRIDDSNGVIIGGDQAGDGNIIANNGNNGILVTGSSVGVSVLGNSVYSNSALGIDLMASGENGDGQVTENDALDSDSGANNLLNFPTLESPIQFGGNTDIYYTLDVPAGDYRVEFFENTSYDASGNGEGKTFIDSQNVTSTGAGVQSFNTTLTGTGLQNVSAVVTEIDAGTPTGFGPSSEFSAAPSAGTASIGLTKSVVDSNSVETDGNIQYDISITNNGTTKLGFTSYDNGDPLNTALFNDIFPTSLDFTSVDGDASCVDENPASGFGSLFSAHTDHTVLSCSYTGADSYLAPGDTLNFVLHFDITNPLNYSQFTNYLLSVPTASDTDYEQYLSVVDDGGDIINTIGTPIDSLVSSTFTPPETDLSLTKVLTNPEDAAPGNTLSYDITVTNNGPGFSNMNRFNNLFTGSSLLTDFVAPDLTPANLGADMGGGFYPLNDVGNTDVDCIWAPHGAAGAFYGFTTHAGYGLVLCQYGGTDPLFLPETSIQLNIDFVIDGNSDLTFKNYAYTSSSFTNFDPDYTALNEAASGSLEFLDALIETAGQINNFMYASLPSDLGVTSTIENPGDLKYDSTVYYDINLENRGPAPVDLKTFNRVENALSLSFYLPSDLTYLESTTTGVECSDIGPVANIGLTAAVQNHTDYHALLCFYNGSEQFIGVNETFTARLAFKSANRDSSTVNVYSLNGSAPFDPDLGALLGGLFGASEDVLDTFTNDNYARVSSTSIASPAIIGNTNQSNNAALSSTGQNVKTYILIASILLICGIASGAYYFTKRQRSAS